MTKPLYFTDETIELNIEIDNSQSTRTIDDIEVNLRNIVSIKANQSKAYSIGSAEYDPTTTKIYDIRKLDFGILQHSENSNKYTAKFDIVDVVSTLF